MLARLWLPLVGTLLLGTSAAAQQTTQAPSAPVEIRLRSINDLLGKADYLAGLIGQQQTLRAFTQQIPLDPQTGLLGVDTRRPIGIYGDLSFDVQEGAAVILLPVAHFETLAGFLQTQLGLQIERRANGILVVQLPPGGPVETLYARLADGYLYVTNRESQLEARNLITAKNFFARNDEAVASLTFRFDRIPAVARRELLAQLDEALRQLQAEALEKTNPAERAGFTLGGKSVISLSRTLIEEVRELHLKLIVDEKRDFVSLDMIVVPNPNSAVAQNFASLGQKTSLAYGVSNIKGVVLRGNLNFALTDDMRKTWDDLIDSLAKEIIDNAPANDRGVAEKIVRSFLPTFKAGVAEAAISMTAPNPRGHYTLLGAVGIKEGKKINAAIAELVNLYVRDTGDTQSVKLNFAQVGQFTLHQIDRSLPPEAEKYFGSRSLWLAVSDDLLVLSAGPDASVLRNALTLKPVAAPALSLDVSLVGLARLANQNVTPQQVNAAVSQIFGPGGPVGKDMLRLSVQGGQNLTMRLSVQGGGIRFLAALMGVGP
jgi:hypothetical protein